MGLGRLSIGAATASPASKGGRDVYQLNDTGGPREYGSKFVIWGGMFLKKIRSVLIWLGAWCWRVPNYLNYMTCWSYSQRNRFTRNKKTSYAH